MLHLLRPLPRRLRQWSVRRHPRQRTVTLTQNRIFILPTGAGLGFLVLLLLLLLLAINYENNLAYALTFLLGGLFVISILHTYGNLAGLRLTALAGHHCFQGESAGFALQLTAAQRRDHEQLRLSWEQGTPLLLDLTEQRSAQVELACPAPRRGWLKPGPLLIETRFPLGLFRAWTWLDTGLDALVYPKPETCSLPRPGEGTGSGNTAQSQRVQGSEEFQGLARYQRGASPRQVAWKVYARGQGLYTKQYDSPVSDTLWLDWDSWPGLGDETRLSRLCFWALELDHRQQPYGLNLPGQQIAPATGPAHRLAVLRALALYGRAQPDQPDQPDGARV